MKVDRRGKELARNQPRLEKNREESMGRSTQKIYRDKMQQETQEVKDNCENSR
jgi:hypothetical protein